MLRSVVSLSAALALVLSATSAHAQMPNPYGPPISLDAAKAAAAPAIAEARRNNWTIAVAIVDAGGNLVYFEKMDNTQLAASVVAGEKAKSAVFLKRPTKALQDALAAGGEGLRMLAITGAVPVDGGFPLIADGKIVGGIGVSGMSSAQDAQCAQAGANAIR